jgi:hypothetical protein
VDVGVAERAGAYVYCYVAIIVIVVLPQQWEG